MKISIVVPVYNEEESISLFLEAIDNILHKTQYTLEFIFVNDGSTDNTENTILKYQQNDSRIKLIDLSRNFGKEAALSAGLHNVSGDVVIPMDVDLQDPPEIILEMLKKWEEGYEVVLARRINRDSDTWEKRASSNWFYKVHNKISSPTLPNNVGDFRLMDKIVVDALNRLPESRRFMKGLFAWIGFKSTFVDYIRTPRATGRSKFNGWKLWNLALESITSFSTIPLRIWTYIGFLTALLSFLFGVIIIFKVLIYGVDFPGYASLMVAITFLGGLQLIGIGVLGEYLGRTYMESKRRPVYIIRKIHTRLD